MHATNSNRCQLTGFLIMGGCCLFLLLGCSSTYEREERGTDDLQLDRADPVYVARAADYVQDGRHFPKSGETTAAALRNTLGRHVSKAILAPETDHFTNTVAAAIAQNCRYLYIPVIRRWEDRQTRTTGFRDHVVIEINLYELPTTNFLQQAVITGKSKWYGAADDDAPEDLLLLPMQDYVLDLYAIRQDPPPVPQGQMLSTDPGF